MSISSLYASQLLGANSASSTVGLPASAAVSLDGSSSASTTPSFSSLSQLFSQLKQLATSNPTQFKAVTAQLSSQLSALAQQSSGSNAQFYSSLAENFGNASQTGDASEFSVPSTSASGTYAITGKMIEDSSVASALLGGSSGQASTSSLLSTLNPSLGSASASSYQDPSSTLENLISQDLSSSSGQAAS